MGIKSYVLLAALFNRYYIILPSVQADAPHIFRTNFIKYLIHLRPGGWLCMENKSMR